MQYRIVMPPAFGPRLDDHLLRDRTHEELAVLLAGRRQTSTHTTLLPRYMERIPAEGFAKRSAIGLELSEAAQQAILRRAAAENLDQIDFHSHPGDAAPVAFSTTDDQHERALAAYLYERFPTTLYASVVVNRVSSAARVWEIRDNVPVPVPIEPPILDGRTFPVRTTSGITIDPQFDRQVRAFGPELQRQVRSITFGVMGLGGLGSLIVDHLAHLGARSFKLVDPDIVEVTNLNRLVGATLDDVAEERAKVDIAARSIRRIEPRARVTTLRSTISSPRALRALRECDFLIAATDDDASRMVLNALACQYLIPLAHVGVNLQPNGNGDFADISGEVALPELGRWCLVCSGIISAHRAAHDLALPDERLLLQQRGYLPGTPAPAVYHLNAVIASLAATEIHNLIRPYKSPRSYLVYRELEGELMTVNVPATEGCPYCSPRGLLGLGDLAPLWRPSRLSATLPEVRPEIDDGELAEAE